MKGQKFTLFSALVGFSGPLERENFIFGRPDNLVITVIEQCCNERNPRKTHFPLGIHLLPTFVSFCFLGRLLFVEDGGVTYFVSIFYHWTQLCYRFSQNR